MRAVFFLWLSVCSLALAEPARYRGWEYLAEGLHELGVSREDLANVYGSKRMPVRGFIPFSVAPREHISLYQGFATRLGYTLCAKYLKAHALTFAAVERALDVPREVIVAILYVESHFGKNTGKESIIYRLSRISSVGETSNIDWNYERLKPLDPTVTRQQLIDRALYLEKTFRPEIIALLKIVKKNRVNIFNVKGSIAGAFGMPQFLPTTFLRFARDGNHDGVTSLFQHADAIWSVATFLAEFGYKKDLTTDQKRAILWRYNKSEAYIDTILKIADGAKLF